MLDGFMARRAELMKQVAALDIESKQAPDTKTKQAVDARAWKLVARVWLYRSRGPLAFMSSYVQIKDYLDYHLREAEADIAAGRNIDGNTELRDEIKVALGILEKDGAVPSF